MVGAWVMAIRLSILAIVMGVVSAASGCGAGALQTHATAAHVVGVMLDGAYDVAEAHLEQEMAVCIEAHDDACVDRVAEAHHPVALGLSSAEIAWSGWVSGIEIAHLSGRSEDLTSALVSMAGRALAGYAAIVEAFAGIGLTIPPVPQIILELVPHE